MNAVVTGANGFIGSVLVRELLRQGRSVRVLVHRKRRALEGCDVEVVEGDICDPQSLAAAFEGAETVFHLAAIIALGQGDQARVEKTNIAGARHCAEAALAAGVKRFVHFSSIHAFDLHDREALIDESSPAAGAHHPLYDRTKAEADRAIREVVKKGLHAVIVHPTATIGPGDRGPSRTGEVLLELQSRKLPALIDGGFNWVDVRDVVQGALHAEEKGRAGEGYILSGFWHTTAELAGFSSEITGVAPPRLVFPLGPARFLAPLGDLWGRLLKKEMRFSSYAINTLCGSPHISCEKAKRELGYAPRAVREAVHDAHRFFVEKGMHPGPLVDVEA